MESPVPQLLPPTTGDSLHFAPDAPAASSFPMPVPTIVYGQAPGLTPGTIVNTASIVPPNMAQPTPDKATSGA